MTSLRRLDDFFADTSYLIFKLRVLSYENKVQEFKALLNDLSGRLFKRAMYAVDAKLWKEVYFSAVWLYPQTKTLGDVPNGIPITLVTKHNDMVQFYMRQRLSEFRGPFIRFDTHEDLNRIHNSAALPELYASYLRTGNQDLLANAQRLVWDIGAAKSGVLFATGTRDVMWVVPKWIPDTECDFLYHIRRGKRECTMVTNDPKTERLSNIGTFHLSKRKPKDAVEANFARLNVSRGDERRKFFKVRDFIVRGLDPEKKDQGLFLLDIDLDYFVSNGSPLNTAKYLEEQFDVQSYNRVEYMEEVQSNPRSVIDFDDAYKRRVSAEVQDIRKRISRFGKLMRYLRSCGLRPAMISVCDSSSVDYTMCFSCASLGNNYMPQNLALLVHTLVMEVLVETWVR